MDASKHLSGEELERYSARQSSVTEVLAVQQHIVGCPECRARLEATVQADAAFLSLRRQIAQTDDSESLAGEIHLPYEQLALYVDDKLDDVEREVADSHLSFCEDCATDLADLRQYQALITGAGAKPASDVAASDTPSAWQNFIAFLGSFKLPAPALAATAAVLVLLTVGGVWLAMRDSDDLERRNEQARLRPESDPTSAPGGVTPTQENVLLPTSSPATSSSGATNGNSANVEQSTASSPDGKLNSPSEIVPHGGHPAPLASQVFALDDGEARISFDARGHLNGLKELSPDARLAVRRALRSRQIETPSSLDNLADGKGGTLMGNNAGGASFALVSPIGKIVRQTRPEFRWRPLAGAKSYAVSIVDSKFRAVEQSPALDKIFWTPGTSLNRGAIYYWQVTATLADGTEITAPAAPAPQARFRVLSANESESIAQLEKTNLRSHLALGVAYARAGLLEEAEAELEKLIKQNPHSPVARDLLRNLQRVRRRGIA